jgi:hypothetical protein
MFAARYTWSEFRDPGSWSDRTQVAEALLGNPVRSYLKISVRPTPKLIFRPQWHRWAVTLAEPLINFKRETTLCPFSSGISSLMMHLSHIRRGGASDWSEWWIQQSIADIRYCRDPLPPEPFGPSDSNVISFVPLLPLFVRFICKDCIQERVVSPVPLLKQVIFNCSER